MDEDEDANAGILPLPQTRFSPTTAGILFLVAGMLVFSIQDVIIKSLSGSYAVLQIVFIRSLVAMLPIGLIVRHENGLSPERSAFFWLLLVNGLGACIAYLFYYLAIAALPLADAVSIYYSTPIFITLLSALTLGEPVGRHRWAAVMLGFVGVVLMIQPGRGVFEPAALLSLLAALAYTVRVLATRKMADKMRGSTMAFYATFVYLIFAGISGLLWGDGQALQSSHPSLQFLLRAWVVPGPWDLALIATTGLIWGVGFFFLSQAYRLGAAADVAPFEYTAVPLAVFWGLVLWGEMPAPLVWLGMVLVVASGLYILHREAVRLGRPRRVRRLGRPSMPVRLPRRR